MRQSSARAIRVAYSTAFSLMTGSVPVPGRPGILWYLVLRRSPQDNRRTSWFGYSVEREFPALSRLPRRNSWCHLLTVRLGAHVQLALESKAYLQKLLVRKVRRHKLHTHRHALREAGRETETR